MENYSAMDSLWLMIGTIFIFMMQPGFAMLETGMTRAKNAGNVMMKNLMDFVIGSLAFCLIGYRIFTGGNAAQTGYPDNLYLMYQVMFCATAATIVSGAMAERTRLAAYIIYSFCISAFIYPIAAHWVWGNGWLAGLSIGTAVGFLDCAGGTVVHTVGGITAFLGAVFLGPRIGKYDAERKSNAIPGHSITRASLGIFLLWFAWFGFNISSAGGISTAEKMETAASVFIVTNLCAASGAATTFFLSWKRYRKPDIAMTLNGVLGGLVASTACCNVIAPWAAVAIGVVAGFLVVYGIELLDRRLYVDDPVGACVVHGVCGIWSTLAVGLFHRESGLLITGDGSRLFIQVIGIISVLLFVTVTMSLLFFVINKAIGLRVEEQEEITGLDYGEHALKSAYSDFAFYQPETFSVQRDAGINQGQTLPGLADADTPEYGRISSVVVICRETKLESLKQALKKIGVMGITVSQVMGCGVQKGNTGYYRGAQLGASLLPKIRVEVVVSKIPVKLVVDTVREVLYTGHIGDGKIFVYDVQNVIKVRTGEQGMKALQDPESYQDEDI